MKTKKTSVHQCYSGSLTVEAAFIVPLVSFLIILIIYFNFYLHDRAKVEASLDSLVAEGGNLIKYGISSEGNILDLNRSILFFYIDDKSDEKSMIESAVNAEFSKGLFIGKVEEINVTTGMTTLQISANLVFDLPMDRVFRFFNINSFTVPIKVESSVFPREETTRILDVSIRTAEGIKGVKSAIDKIVDLLSKLS